LMNKWEYTCDGIGNSVYRVTTTIRNGAEFPQQWA